MQPHDPGGGADDSVDDVGMRTGRQIVSIVWNQKDHLIEVAYDVGETDRLEGPHQLAAGLAADAALTFVPTRDGTVQWTKAGPDDWWSS